MRGKSHEWPALISFFPQAAQPPDALPGFSALPILPLWPRAATAPQPREQRRALLPNTAPLRSAAAGATFSEVLSSLATTSTIPALAANQSLQPHQISPQRERSPGYWSPSMACFWLPADPASINGNLSPKPRSVAMGDCSFYGISLAQEPGHQY